MPENARRFAALYDQFEEEPPVADWGGDDLFRRMPRPRPVDDAPAPRFRPSLVVSEPAEARPEPGATEPEPPAAESSPAPRRPLALVGSAESLPEESVASRDHLSVVEPSHRFDESGALIEPEPGARRTKVITGRPGDAPRPLPAARRERRRAPRTPAEWIGPRPERIVAWAFALGLLLILIAITTADAATV